MTNVEGKYITIESGVRWQTRVQIQLLPYL